MSFTLLIMAAGLGTRFGGDKQLVEVGPAGEAFFDYAIRDAQAAGADRVVMIVRTEIEADVRDHLHTHHGPELPVAFVRQDAFGPPRTKPWGTAHAVLAAREVVTEPFVVVNADDYYGQRSYGHLAARMGEIGPRSALLTGFELGRTLPPSGSVSRGICRVDPSGRLESIVETHGIARRPDGTIVATDPPGDLDATAPVSMNMWAFPPQVFDTIEHQFDEFLTRHAADAKAEFLLPTAVADQMAAGQLEVAVVATDDDWIGVTNPDDLGPARRVLAARAD